MYETKKTVTYSIFILTHVVSVYSNERKKSECLTRPRKQSEQGNTGQFKFLVAPQQGRAQDLGGGGYLEQEIGEKEKNQKKYVKQRKKEGPSLLILKIFNKILQNVIALS